MLLAYLDESYDDDYYWISALICHEPAIQQLTDTMDAIARRTAVAHHTPWEAEFHGHDLFQAKADWVAMKEMHQARIAVYRNVFEAIADAEVRLIVRGVDRNQLLQRYGDSAWHPHLVVLSHVLERVDEYAERVNELALVIADQISDEDTYRLNLWNFQRTSTIGYRARQLTRIVDTLHFVPSNRSRLVQAADMIAFLKRRMMSTAPQNQRVLQANQRLWDILAPRMHHEGCWYP
ncbi:hypothetical protein DVS28_a4825 [Euzebya pacifica]|uniref:DUF3800 domain-containing protein n=1 Tax=Euzebya pacifica TaxID=1608957 RepID=A0A346Y4T6_9ACTN|nr:DUF3800 domain-containing protein [Euzebya pacifica]AXV09483.1 hypothetical protein DVS28_a4825 [Euzebya pacifica]